MNFGMGFLFFQIGLYEPAIDYCLKAIEIDPLFLHPYMTGCRCMIYNGEYDRAGVYLKKATDLYPNHPRILEFLCLLDLRTGRLDEAEKLIRRLDNIALKILDTNRWRMLLYALRGQRERALSLNYQSPEAYSRMGMVDEAIAIMEKRIRGGKDSYDYLYLIHNPHYDNLREDRRFQKIVADARKIYEDRLKKFPVDQPFYTDTKGLSNFNQK
jgi:tetratricopeptide (TPR) repeat protein